MCVASALFTEHSIAGDRRRALVLHFVAQRLDIAMSAGGQALADHYRLFALATLALLLGIVFVDCSGRPP